MPPDMIVPVLDGQIVTSSSLDLFSQAGLRTCLGKESAYTQMKITAAILCRFYEFQLVKGHHVTYRTMTILSMANGLNVNVKRRDEASPHVDASGQCEQNSINSESGGV